MKVKIITLVLSILFAMPVFLCAEEMEIPLMEVVGMEVIEGENPPSYFTREFKKYGVITE